MKLISMTDFVFASKFPKTREEAESELVLIDNFYNEVCNYATFLKQPLTLGMFVPCGERYQNVLKEPNRFNFEHDRDYDIYLTTYAKAKEKVLFQCFEIRTEKKKQFIGVEGYEIELPLEKYKMTIEDLANDWKHIELTKSAIKQIAI